ncbi:hypothetical protein C8F01DRAFT_1275124 [Mycena amicta]|nr:hypothetical protein C8F01DRAFT_1275124 [Mycena amicta]
MSDREAAFILGPWVIGTCIELVFQGIVSGQIVKYFSLFGKSDPLSLRFYVGVLMVLTVAKSCLNFTIVWRQCIINYGRLYDPCDTVLISVHGILGALIALYVQGYYLLHLFRLSRGNSFIVVPVALVLLMGFIMTLVANGIRIHSNGRNQHGVVGYYHVNLPLVMSGNFVLTFTTAYLLLRFRKTHNILPQNEILFKTFLRLAFQTAAAPTLGSLVAFIFSRTFPDPYPTARSRATMCVSIVLTKLWAFSIMWTLNARVDEQKSNVSTGAQSGVTSRPDEEARSGRLSTISFGARTVMDDDDDENLSAMPMRQTSSALTPSILTRPMSAHGQPRRTHGHPVRFSAAASSTCASGELESPTEEGDHKAEEEFKGLTRENVDNEVEEEDVPKPDTAEDGTTGIREEDRV